jgi:hypothetical protein
VHFDYLDQQAKKSCQQQFAIEQADNSSFDAYLEHYFIDGGPGETTDS